MTSRRSARRRALVPAVLGPAAFGVAAFAGARMVPGYRPRDEPISALAAHHSAAAPVMVPGFLGLAAGTLALGRQLRGTRMPNSVATAMTVAGVSTALAGLARHSDPTCPSRAFGNSNSTLSDEVHIAVSSVVFSAWIAMPFMAATRGTQLTPSARAASFGFGAAALAGWVWTAVRVQRGELTWTGVGQRVTLAAALGWYPVAALASFEPA